MLDAKPETVKLVNGFIKDNTGLRTCGGRRDNDNNQPLLSLVKNAVRWFRSLQIHVELKLFCGKCKS
jgi:hypothetical protein